MQKEDWKAGKKPTQTKHKQMHLKKNLPPKPNSAIFIVQKNLE